MDRHVYACARCEWLGQGAKGKALPQDIDEILDRIRKYIISEAAQPLAVVGDPGAGRTSFLHTCFQRFSKRFPEPETIVVMHCAGSRRDSEDPVLWGRRLCLKLAKKLKIELPVPVRAYLALCRLWSKVLLYVSVLWLISLFLCIVFVTRESNTHMHTKHQRTRKAEEVLKLCIWRTYILAYTHKYIHK
jgi:hypothetical protein